MSDKDKSSCGHVESFQNVRLSIKNGLAPCLFCGRSTRVGSGLFHDRILGEREDDVNGEWLDGFICRSCIEEDEG